MAPRKEAQVRNGDRIMRMAMRKKQKNGLLFPGIASHLAFFGDNGERWLSHLQETAKPRFSHFHITSQRPP
jgi:hypothetical protein